MKISIDLPQDYIRETVTELKVPPETKKVWAVQIDLLSVVDRICRKHGIRYSIDSGTLLGAVRHGGMIPWDDDIDVIMPRKDYEYFCQIAPKEISGPYFLQTAENDRRYYRGFARLRNNTTTGAFESEMIDGKLYLDYNQAMFVDIFPADNVPDDEDERKAFMCETIRLKGILWSRMHEYSRFRFRKLRGIRSACSLPFIKGAWISFMERIFHIDLLKSAYDRFIKTCRRYEHIETTFVSPVAHRPYETLAITEFDDLADYPFEFITVKGFRNYDRLLTLQYGNWREHRIVIKDKMFFDVEHPYTEHYHEKLVKKGDK